MMLIFLLFFQSLHSGCENDPIDLEGLHESVVDSDEDLADSMDVSFFFNTIFKNFNSIFFSKWYFKGVWNC